MVQKMITEFLTSTLFLLKRLAPIYILSKIYVSNVMFLFQKIVTTEILDMCVNVSQLLMKHSTSSVVIRNGISVKKYPKKV